MDKDFVLHGRRVYSQDGTEKLCSKCVTYKPLEDFYFIKSIGKYGAKCKECEKARRKKYYAENKLKCDALPPNKPVSPVFGRVYHVRSLQV